MKVEHGSFLTQLACELMDCDSARHAAKRSWMLDPLQIRKTILVGAGVDAVWTAFTTTSGLATFFAPDSQIEPRLGGRYDLYFAPDAPAGERGSEDCKALMWSPPTPLARSAELHVELRFPPHLSILADDVSVAELRFLPDQGHHLVATDETRIELHHRGFQSEASGGPRPRCASTPAERTAAFADGHRYWNRAWATVLARLVTHFRAHGA
jgi:hypothetical protein